MIRPDFPKMDLFQLSPGSFRAWIFQAQMENCRIAAGNFNQSMLCEGRYNTDTLHLGFILSLGQSAIVQAHPYDNGTLTVHQNAIAMHEVFPPDLTWVDIAIPKQNAARILAPAMMNKIARHSQLFLEGDREVLVPLIQWVTHALAFPEEPPAEQHLQESINQVLSDKLEYKITDTSFTEGDRFRMHMVEVIHQLKKTSATVCPLAQIAAAANMKPRTVQKYFYEIYGMGPTAYFRIRRLNLARADLLADASKVIEVAQQRKFQHLGRFAGRYKKHFGESPSSTLKRSTHK